jgi:pyridoxine kinase
MYICNCYTGGKKAQVTICIPKLPCTFTGTGDLFAALLLAWMWRTNNQLKPSLENIIATLQAVLRKTLHYAKGITTY